MLQQKSFAEVQKKFRKTLSFLASGRKERIVTKKQGKSENHALFGHIYLKTHMKYALSDITIL